MSKVVWHNVLEEKMPEDQNILAFNENWVDSECNVQGIRIGRVDSNTKEFICAEWDESEATYTNLDIDEFNKNNYPEYWAKLPYVEMY